MAPEKELQDKLVDDMKRWQKIEHAVLVATGEIVQKTSHPLIREVMEIIEADSQRHLRVQQLIIDNFERRGLMFTPEDLTEIRSLVEKHIELERKTVAVAKEALEALKGSGLVVVQYLIEYLLEDENKHNRLLDNLEGIRKGLYPFG